MLDHLLPLLTAVEPAKLSATLTAVSQALQGRGEQLGRTLVALDAHLKKLNPQLPLLNRDIAHLVKVGHLYADAAPDVLDALTDFTTTSGTIAGRQAGLADLYGSTTATARDLTAFLRHNKNNLIRLAAVSRPTLGLLARYSPSFPCTLRTLAGFVPAMDKALGKGTDEPGLHVNVTTVPSLGAYVPGKDTPVYTSGGGPHCYSVPYTGSPAPAATAAANLGLPNSPRRTGSSTNSWRPNWERRPRSCPTGAACSPGRSSAVRR